MAMRHFLGSSKKRKTNQNSKNYELFLYYIDDLNILALR